jgi:FkbM family methyltransferase
MIDRLSETAKQWIPLRLKDLLRRSSTRAYCQLSLLSGLESIGSHLSRLFGQLHINCVFDVGANGGQYGRFLRGLGYRGRIVSFEPVSASFAVLARRRARDSDWKAHRIALGEREESLLINVTAISQFSSFLLPNRYSETRFGPYSSVENTEKVRVQRLASVFEECIAGIREPRVFLKMDTQGYDLNVLAGAGRRVEQVLALQSEVSVKAIYDKMPGYLEAVAKMTSMGFELTGLFPVDRDKELRVIELDCVMRRGPSGSQLSPSPEA